MWSGVRRSITSVAEFIDPDWGDKVNSGIGLLYWSASPWRLAKSDILEKPKKERKYSINYIT
jgi:hypothetical protein